MEEITRGRSEVNSRSVSRHTGGIRTPTIIPITVFDFGPGDAATLIRSFIESVTPFPATDMKEAWVKVTGRLSSLFKC
jgi:hypothetical protein